MRERAREEGGGRDRGGGRKGIIVKGWASLKSLKQSAFALNPPREVCFNFQQQNQHPLVHRPLDAGYYSVVDEPQLS